jgi:hypothetical protein
VCAIGAVDELVPGGQHDAAEMNVVAYPATGPVTRGSKYWVTSTMKIPTSFTLNRQGDRQQEAVAQGFQGAVRREELLPARPEKLPPEERLAQQMRWAREGTRR